MSDFNFLHNPAANQWVVLAPRRAKRPDQNSAKAAPSCPFCPGTEAEQVEVYRIPGQNEDSPTSPDGLRGASNWDVRVLANKYPFAPIHEVIIHSQDHHKNFNELPLERVEKILQCYKDRYNEHKDKGTVYIFHNFGERAGESLPHPHTQLVVIPHNVRPDIPPLALADEEHHTDHFTLFAPTTSQWPDEVWIAPKQQGFFGDISSLQERDLAFTLKRLIEIFSIRHGQEFPFNFYIYPYKNWYIRMIPRMKRLGGFEVGTNIFVNTQDPKETMSFIQEHFLLPNKEKILTDHMAGYDEGV